MDSLERRDRKKDVFSKEWPREARMRVGRRGMRRRIMWLEELWMC